MADATPPERSAAEWVTFAVACLVLLVLVGLILTQTGGRDDPASPVATIDGPPHEEGGMFFVSVRVENRGDVTAGEVQVQAELKIGDETATGDQTIAFLPGDDEEDLVFTFDDDPSSGELSVRVTGFATP